MIAFLHFLSLLVQPIVQLTRAIVHDSEHVAVRFRNVGVKVVVRDDAFGFVVSGRLNGGQIVGVEGGHNRARILALTICIRFLLLRQRRIWTERDAVALTDKVGGLVYQSCLFWRKAAASTSRC